MVDLSITIVNLNTRDMLRDCLKSIYAATHKISFDVYVVDKTSTDGSADMVRQEFPQAHLMVVPREVFYTVANNTGLRAGQGRYLLSLNPDTIILDGALDQMVDFCDQHPEIGILGPKLLNADGTLQRSCWLGFPSLRSAVIDAFYLWRLLPRSTIVQASEVPEEKLQEPREVDHLLGAALILPRRVTDKVGLMDERLHLYLDETEWCYRIKQASWKVYYLPTAQIIHFGQQTTSKEPTNNLPMNYRNFTKFYRETAHPTVWHRAALKVVIVLGCLLRLGLWSWRARKPERREKALNMRHGYWQVIQELPSF